MTLNLTITLIVSSILLIILTSYFLIKQRITEKYAIIWYMFSLLIFVASFFPRIFDTLAKLFGFQLMSNMVILLLIGILFLLVMSLTIMMAGQKKKVTLLIEELSILKNEMEEKK